MQKVIKQQNCFTLFIFFTAIQVQGDGRADPRGVCHCRGPSRPLLPHLAVEQRGGGEEEGLPAH